MLDLCMLIMRWVECGDEERSCMACLEFLKISSDVALQDVGLLGQQLCLAQVQLQLPILLVWLEQITNHLQQQNAM